MHKKNARKRKSRIVEQKVKQNLDAGKKEQQIQTQSKHKIPFPKIPFPKIPFRGIIYIKDIIYSKFSKSKIKKSGVSRIDRKRRLRVYLNKAGIEVKSDEVFKRIFNIGILINLVISALLLYYISNRVVTWATVAILIFLLWVIIFVVIIFAEWVIFYTLIDLKIYNRKLEIEEVLPDFLQLTAANIKSGMSVDKAMWYAVRPRFGILAKEIEFVAKETMSGTSLQDSLRRFAEKYDSIVLKRSINMLIEGIEAGGEIGDLLNKIADYIQEHKIMMKEISASVTTYSIFIIFAAVIAAPFLFALSGALIKVIHNLESTLGAVSSAATGLIPLRFTGVGISIKDFRIFSVVSLLMTSLFSSMIIAAITKGNVKSGLKYVPVFMLVSLIVYTASVKISNLLLGLVL